MEGMLSDQVIKGVLLSFGTMIAVVLIFAFAVACFFICESLCRVKAGIAWLKTAIIKHPEKVLGGIVVFVLPIIIVTGINLHTDIILGALLTGYALGIFLAPACGWKFRHLGLAKAILISIATWIGSGWIGLMFLAMLIAAASD